MAMSPAAIRMPRDVSTVDHIDPVNQQQDKGRKGNAQSHAIEEAGRHENQGRHRKNHEHHTEHHGEVAVQASILQSDVPDDSLYKKAGAHHGNRKSNEKERIE